MIKINFAKFILLFALALVSMNACYPSDFECADNNEVVSKVERSLTAEHTETASHGASTDGDAHHCLCSLTCHTLFISQSNFENFTYAYTHFSKTFLYTSQFYPQVSYSLEKPPTV